jgi:hypothetical protein
MAKNKSRKRSTRRKRGGADAPNVPAAPNAPNAPNVPSATPNTTRAPNAPATTGGKRKTRKVSKGASDWNKKVMEVYRELKKKNPATKLGDAMRECSKRKKRGDF